MHVAGAFLLALMVTVTDDDDADDRTLWLRGVMCVLHQDPSLFGRCVVNSTIPSPRRMRCP